MLLPTQQERLLGFAPVERRREAQEPVVVARVATARHKHQPKLETSLPMKCGNEHQIITSTYNLTRGIFCKWNGSPRNRPNSRELEGSVLTLRIQHQVANFLITLPNRHLEAGDGTR